MYNRTAFHILSLVVAIYSKIRH